MPLFLRQASSLSFGTVLGTMCVLLASPFLTRFYSPEDFGTFNTVFGAAALIATISSLSYPTAIPLAADDHEASDLVWLTVIGGLLLIPPTTVAAGLFLKEHLVSTSSFDFLLNCSVLAFVTSVGIALRALAARQSKFAGVSSSSVLDSGVQAGGQLLCAQFSPGAAGLAVGYVGGKIVSGGVLAWLVRHGLFTPRHLRRVTRTWTTHSLFLTPTTLLNQASVAAVGPFIVALFGVAIGGQFALASRMLALPSVLIGQAIAVVFFPHIARMKQANASRTEAVQKVATSLTAIAVPVFSITALFGPELFGFLFGDRWTDAGWIAAVLSPWLAANLVSSPISSVMTVENRNGNLLLVACFETFLRVGALILGFHFEDWRVGVALYSVVGVAVSTWSIGWAINLAGGSFRGWFMSVARRHAFHVVTLLLLLVLKSTGASLAFVPLALILLAVSATRSAVFVYRTSTIRS